VGLTGCRTPTRPQAETSGATTTLVRGFRLGYPIGRSSQFRFGVPVTRRTPQPALGVSRLALCCFYCGMTAHGPTVIHIRLRRTSTSRLNRTVPPSPRTRYATRMSVPVGPILSRVDHKGNSLPHHRRFRELSRFPSPTADGRSTAGQSPRRSTRTRQGPKGHPAPPISLFCGTTRTRVHGQNAQKAKIARYADCEHNRDAVRADP
jgi:hypothetical protein